jgi:4-hydroxybenzoate polyprenyltransferase
MPTPPATAKSAAVPLCVDLDGTLLRTDMLWEGFVRLLRRNPLYLFAVLAWWCRGRACLKQQIARRVEVPVASLPHSESFLSFLRAEHAAGRPLYLVTASDAAPAARIATHVGLFSGVLASDGQTNLRGAAKGRKLAERFGKGGFNYAGNSSVDLGVWPHAREAIVVNGSPSLVRRAGSVTKLGPTFDCAPAHFTALVKALRPHQWIKNLIVFVPILTAHRLLDPATMLAGIWAAVAFSLCSSAVYMLNDLLDLDADRAHPTRRLRPFASGALPLPVGLTLVPLLFAAGLGLGVAHSLNLLVVLAIYAGLTLAYSWRLKQVALLDVFLLASFYTLRLIAGHEATGIVYSVWLLVFAMFVFLSLALVKRFCELQGLRARKETDAAGRGYVANDLELVATLGTSSGWLAALVLALYVNSPEVRVLYAHPMVLLLVCPLLLFWVSRVWLIAHRGAMHDDPVVFAIKDWVSYCVGGLTLLVLWLATG